MIKNQAPRQNASTRQGYFYPKSPDKYVGQEPIIYRSGWELQFCRWCDTNPTVKRWASEPVEIPYLRHDGSRHRYYPDFMVVYEKDGVEVTAIFEVKPAAQLRPPKQPKRNTRKLLERYNMQLDTYMVNRAKYKAAVAWCEQRGYKFYYATETFFK